MPDNPLILFADPTPVNKTRRYGGPSDFYYPSHQRQVERLAPKFNTLKQAIDKGRVKIAQNPDGVPLEYTLVLEVAGDPSGFETAVRHLKGNTNDIEWLFEVVDDNVPNADDFYRTKNGDRDDTKKMSFKYFCVVANQRVIDEILSLWQNYQQDENCTFPLGQSGLRNVFKTLRDIHLWGIAERLEETGILDVWTEQLSDPDEVDVNCEIELFFRQSPVKRIQTQNQLAQYIENIGGNVITSSCIEAIGYHAILASIPRQYAEQIVRKEYVELVQFDSIMFLKPSGQTIVLGTDDGLQFEKAFSAPEDIIDEPIVALFDGLPQERHPLLDGFLLIDDPDDFTSAYQIDDRQHGTSMASLIARGDLSDELASVTTHKIYVRPIMKPYPAYDGTQEFIPDNILIVDKIHEAVRRLYEPEAGKVATSIRVINLSIGIGERMYYNMISPLAKLLDWLSFKYRVLFVVSAGNHSDDIDLGLTFNEYKALSIEQRDSRMIQILNRDSRNLRLLSPAESMNAITVGALFSDNCIWTENVRQLLPASNTLPSPTSSMGRGINNSIKPDILYLGGRNFLRENMTMPNIAHWRKGTSTYPPGILSAKPCNVAKAGNLVGYSTGTSDAAALISHEAVICYDTLNNVFNDELGTDIPFDYASLMLKAMLVHGAGWDSNVVNLICREVGLKGRGADQVHKWIGYGVPNIKRVQEYAKNRITLIGYGELVQDTAALYELPLPFNFSKQKMYRCLTVTLASFTPIRPATQKYRSSQIWFNLEPGDKNHGLKRLDADDKAVARGTLQHERFGGNSAVVWGEDDILGIKINCRADAHDFTEQIPYALFATFEIAPEHNIDVYEKIAEKVRQKVKEAVKPK